MSICNKQDISLKTNNGSSLNQLKNYLNFSYIGPIWIWWIVVFLVILQLNYMRRATLDYIIKSEFYWA